MNLDPDPGRVATGINEEGMLVFDGEQRLVAALIRLTDSMKACRDTGS